MVNSKNHVPQHVHSIDDLKVTDINSAQSGRESAAAIQRAHVRDRYLALMVGQSVQLSWGQPSSRFQGNYLVGVSKAGKVAQRR